MQRALLTLLLTLAKVSTKAHDTYVSAADCSVATVEKHLTSLLSSGQLSAADATSALLAAECESSCCTKCHRAGWLSSKCKIECCRPWVRDKKTHQCYHPMPGEAGHATEKGHVGLCAAPTPKPTPIPTPEPTPQPASVVSAHAARYAAEEKAKRQGEHVHKVKERAAVRAHAEARWKVAHRRQHKRHKHVGFPALTHKVNGKLVWNTRASDCDIPEAPGIEVRGDTGNDRGWRAREEALTKMTPRLCAWKCCQLCVRALTGIGECHNKCCRAWTPGATPGECAAGDSRNSPKWLRSLGLPLCEPDPAKRLRRAVLAAKARTLEMRNPTEEGIGWDDDTMLAADAREIEGGKLDPKNAAALAKMLSRASRQNSVQLARASDKFETVFNRPGKANGGAAPHGGQHVWPAWDGSGSCSGAPCGVRCAQDVHDQCRKYNSASQCAGCARELGVPAGDACAPAHLFFVCRHMILARKAAQLRHETHSSRNARYTQPEFRPQISSTSFNSAEPGVTAGFSSIFGEIGACILDKAQVLLDIALLMSTCTEYVGFRGAECFKNDAQDFVANLRFCCEGDSDTYAARSGGRSTRATLKNVHHVHEIATRSCYRAITPALQLLENRLIPRWEKCKGSFTNCVGLHTSLEQCNALALGPNGDGGSTEINTPRSAKTSPVEVAKHLEAVVAAEQRKERAMQWDSDEGTVQGVASRERLHKEQVLEHSAVSKVQALEGYHKAHVLASRPKKAIQRATLPILAETNGAGSNPPWRKHKPMPKLRLHAAYEHFVKRHARDRQRQKKLQRSSGPQAYDRFARSAGEKPHILRHHVESLPYIGPDGKWPTRRLGGVESFVSDLAEASPSELQKHAHSKGSSQADSPVDSTKIASSSLLEQVLLHASSSQLRSKFGARDDGRAQLDLCLSMVKGAPAGDMHSAELGRDVPFASIFRKLTEGARDMYFTADPVTQAHAAQDITPAAREVLNLCDTMHSSGGVISDDDDDVSANEGATLNDDDMCALRLASFVQGVHSSQTGFDTDLGDPREQ